MMKDKIAKIIKKYYNNKCELKNITPLTGGMVSKIFLVITEFPEERFVLKYSEKEDKGFKGQYECLEILNKEYHFPVPVPYFCSAYDKDVGCSYLGMEYWDAENMGEARFTAENRKIIEHEIAESISKLHNNTDNEHYYLFSKKRYKKLYQIMEKKYQENLTPAVKKKIGEKYYKELLRIFEKLDKILIDNDKPVLVHGDIWSTNVMLENKNGVYHLKGFVDPSPHFINREYELAYLQVFGMFSDELFRHYRKFHTIDEGFQLRRHFYWLLTMLIHVNYFGDLHYVLRTMSLIKTCKKILSVLKCM